MWQQSKEIAVGDSFVHSGAEWLGIHPFVIVFIQRRFCVRRSDALTSSMVTR